MTVKVEIKPGYRTDHSLITLELNYAEQHRGRGLFKFNCSLLRDSNYSALVKQVIKNTITDYALPVYRTDFLVSSIGIENLNEIQFTISDSLLFDVLILNIRTETITYGIRKSKQFSKEEDKLNAAIAQLEQQMNVNPSAEIAEQLTEKHKQLEEVREVRLHGSIRRSRARWFEEGEKSSKYFLNLEKRNYISKLIPCLRLDNGEVVQSQFKILETLQQHYGRMFCSHDYGDNDPGEFLDSIQLKELSDTEIKRMKEPLTLDKVSRALFDMKNNKSPGIDGFPAEFYKYFWQELKFIVLRMFKSCYEAGTMPVSLQEGVITLIPKSGKPRNLINSYRPITLLNTSYKLLSASIANRYKESIHKLVDPEQSGFIKGRFIGDNTRLMSDVMAYLRHEKRSGIFLSLDIEGAFNTVSWKFIKAVLSKYKFPDEMIRWFNLMNEGTNARILYNGHLSEKISMFRACRQGDPISPYIFLLAIEGLAAKIRQNNTIKGITISGVEVKVSSYADDTLFFLDGSVNSCRHLFHDLGVYAKFSGLRPNIAKTQAMWVGYEVEEKTGICEELPIQWTKRMKVLGVVFENNDVNMLNSNFEPKIDEVTAIVNSWRQRHLTIYGKICVVKCLLLPKLTHLLSALPNPPSEFMEKLNTILFKFIWNGKRDKIKRKSVVLPTECGGAGMVDVRLYNKSLKVSWVRRQLCSDNYWAKLFDLKISQGDFIWDRNNKSLRCFSSQLHFIRFWKDVIEALADYKEAYKPTDNDPTQISSCNIWYSDYSKFSNGRINAWFSKGIRFLNDLLDVDGNIMTFDRAKQIYDISGLAFDYSTLILSLPRHWRVENKVKLIGPLIEPLLLSVVSQKQGVKHIYRKLIQNQTSKHTHIWERRWDDAFPDIVWADVYKNNVRAITSTRYRSLQYKIITRTHVTQQLLHHMGESQSCLCLRCNRAIDKIEHKFWFCLYVRNFWREIEDWLLENGIIKRGNNLTSKTVLLGLGSSTLLNHIMVAAKMIIAKNEPLRLNGLINRLRDDRELEEIAYTITDRRRIFTDKWDRAETALAFVPAVG